jgi:hypothetical protein
MYINSIVDHYCAGEIMPLTKTALCERLRRRHQTIVSLWQRAFVRELGCVREELAFELDSLFERIHRLLCSDRFYVAKAQKIGADLAALCPSGSAALAVSVELLSRELYSGLADGSEKERNRISRFLGHLIRGFSE